MKTAYSYIRLSSKKQTKGSGAERQTKKAIEICKENGWNLSHLTFTDLGVSAYSGDNRLNGDLSIFIGLAKDAKLGNEPVLIIEQFDRFSRQDIDESEPAIIDLLKTGCCIHVAFVNKTFTKNSTKELGSRIEILLSLKQAHEYSANLSKRIKSANISLRNRINAGEVMKIRNVPRYYTFDTIKKQYIQNDYSKIVSGIIKEYTKGISLYSIAKEFNKRGIKPFGYRTDATWNVINVKQILNNPALHGQFYENKKFYSEPICSETEFNQIQNLLFKNRNNKGRFNSDYINIFKGLAKCPYCKESFSFFQDLKNRKTNKPHKTPYRYLRCSGVSNGNNCINKHSMNVKDIEDEFFSVFLQSDPNALFSDKAKNDHTEEITAIDAELIKISAKITKYLSLNMELEELQAVLNDLKKTKDCLLKQKQELSMATIEDTTRKDLLLNFKKLYSEWIKMDATKEDGVKFNDAVLALRQKLSNVELRAKIRDMLPTIVSRIEFDSINEHWTVFDLTGKQVYRSIVL